MDINEILNNAPPAPVPLVPPMDADEIFMFRPFMDVDAVLNNLPPPLMEPRPELFRGYHEYGSCRFGLGRIVDEQAVKPQDIYFTKPCIEGKFGGDDGSCSLQLDDAVERIFAGTLSPEAFPTMRVITYRNRLWSEGNKRLWVFRKAEVKSIRVKFVTYDFDPGKSNFERYAPQFYEAFGDQKFFPSVNDDIKQIFAIRCPHLGPNANSGLIRERFGINETTRNFHVISDAKLASAAVPKNQRDRSPSDGAIRKYQEDTATSNDITSLFKLKGPIPNTKDTGPLKSFSVISEGEGSSGADSKESDFPTITDVTVASLKLKGPASEKEDTRPISSIEGSSGADSKESDFPAVTDGTVASLKLKGPASEKEDTHPISSILLPRSVMIRTDNGPLNGKRKRSPQPLVPKPALPTLAIGPRMQILGDKVESDKVFHIDFNSFVPLGNVSINVETLNSSHGEEEFPIRIAQGKVFGPIQSAVATVQNSVKSRGSVEGDHPGTVQPSSVCDKRTSQDQLQGHQLQDIAGGGDSAGHLGSGEITPHRLAHLPFTETTMVISRSAEGSSCQPGCVSVDSSTGITDPIRNPNCKLKGKNKQKDLPGLED